MQKSGLERIRKRLATSVVVAMMLLLSMSIMAMGANQLHWGFEDRMDLPAGQDRGISYFVDASRPDDTGDGLTWATAKKTIQAAVNLATSGNGDYIYVKKGDYMDERVVVDKDNLHIIGEWYCYVREFDVQGDAVEITSFSVASSEPYGSSITVTGYLYLHHNFITPPPSGVGLSLISPGSGEIFSNIFYKGGDGAIAIQIPGYSMQAAIYDNDFLGSDIGVQINYASAFYHLIYNNRFFGRGTSSKGTYAIQILAGKFNKIYNNWIGEYETPIYDGGTDNTWLDNHWEGWEGSESISAPIEEVVLSYVDIPSAGKVTVRFTFNPNDAAIPEGTTITVRMKDPTSGVLLAPPGRWTKDQPDQVFPTVEATFDGGPNQMTLTIEPSQALTWSLVVFYKIMDT